MRRLLTHRPDKDAPAAREEVRETEESAADDDYVGGWSTGARANTSALLRWTAWSLLLIGPVLGAAAFTRASTTSTAQPSVAARTPAGTGSQGAAGFATLFVAQYLRAGEGDQDKLAAYYPPAVDVQLEGAPGRRHGEQLTVVRLRQTAPDVWSVTVAARIVADAEPTPEKTTRSDADRSDAKTAAAAAARDSIHYFQVPVAVGPAEEGATGYAALSMPSEVAAPARIKAPDLIYGPSQPAAGSDPRTQAVTEFLIAYLTGSGELDRYLAPGTQLSPVQPTPYTGLAVDQMAIEGDQAADPITTVPEDGTRTRVVVTVRATDHDNVRVPLAYALTLKARAGRWEIAGLDGAPSPVPTAHASATGTPRAKE
ncbi:conjugal transfer protein [Streptomyces anthocyanicus]|uniref:conjugal transfer protein n=1 Tax=Streptomyces anthocyanicus TaxID=68174 RepID=UPI00382C0C9F